MCNLPTSNENKKRFNPEQNSIRVTSDGIAVYTSKSRLYLFELCSENRPFHNRFCIEKFEKELFKPLFTS